MNESPYIKEVQPMIEFLAGATPYSYRWLYSLPYHQLRAIYWNYMKKRLKRNKDFNLLVLMKQGLELHDEMEKIEPRFKTINEIEYTLVDSGEWEMMI